MSQFQLSALRSFTLLCALAVAPLSTADAQSLTFIESLDGSAIDSPRAVAVSPDAGTVYMANFFGDSLNVFSRDDSDGSLTLIQTLTDGVAGVDGLFRPTSVAVSSDDQNVYVAGSGDNAIAVFDRDPATGMLTFLELQRNLAGSVAGGLAGARSVVVTADGNFVYGTGPTDDGVAIFSRDAPTGRLTFVDFVKQGIDGVDGISSATSIAATSDGLTLLVTSPSTNSLAVFEIDPATGLLTYVEKHVDGVNGVDGLESAREVAASPDGDHVYVTSPLDSAIAIFSRDAATGSLSYVGIAQNGFLGISGLLNTRGVAVGDASLFATGFLDDAVVGFARDDETGLLTFIENERDGENGVDGLDGASAVALNADASSVYTTAELDSAIAVFASNGALPPPPPPGTGDLDGQTITYQWRFPELDGTILEGPTPVVVGAGTELVGIGLGNIDLDISANNLRLEWTGDLPFSGSESNFNGHIYSDGSGAMAPFETVTINPATNLAGFDMSRIDFDDDNIRIDFSGLGGSAGTVLSLDITLVPEPSAAAGFLATLLTVLGLRRRSAA